MIPNPAHNKKLLSICKIWLGLIQITLDKFGLYLFVHISTIMALSVQLNREALPGNWPSDGPMSTLIISETPPHIPEG
jgi:hypothetical protein